MALGRYRVTMLIKNEIGLLPGAYTGTWQGYEITLPVQQGLDGQVTITTEDGVRGHTSVRLQVTETDIAVTVGRALPMGMR